MKRTLILLALIFALVLAAAGPALAAEETATVHGALSDNAVVKKVVQGAR